MEYLNFLSFWLKNIRTAFSVYFNFILRLTLSKRYLQSFKSAATRNANYRRRRTKTKTWKVAEQWSNTEQETTRWREELWTVQPAILMQCYNQVSRETLSDGRLKQNHYSSLQEWSRRSTVRKCTAFCPEGPQFDSRWSQRLFRLSSDPCSLSFKYP